MKSLRWREETVSVNGRTVPFRWSTDGARVWVNCLTASDLTMAAGTESNNRAVAKLLAEGLFRRLSAAPGLGAT